MARSLGCGKSEVPSEESKSEEKEAQEIPSSRKKSCFAHTKNGESKGEVSKRVSFLQGGRNQGPLKKNL